VYIYAMVLCNHMHEVKEKFYFWRMGRRKPEGTKIMYS